MPAVHGLYCVTSVEALASDMVPRRPAAGGRWRARWHHGLARRAAGGRAKCDQRGGTTAPRWSHFGSTLVTRPVHAGHTIAQHPVRRVAPRDRTPGLAPVTAGPAAARRGGVVAGPRGRDGACHCRRARRGCRHPRWSHRLCEQGRAWNDGQRPPISTLVTQPPPQGPPWNASVTRRGGSSRAVLGTSPRPSGSTLVTPRRRLGRPHRYRDTLRLLHAGHTRRSPVSGGAGMALPGGLHAGHTGSWPRGPRRPLRRARPLPAAPARRRPRA